MKKERLYLITFNKLHDRHSQPCDIIGMKRITNYQIGNANTSIDTYHVRYEDGHEEYIPLTSINESHFHFVTLSDMLRYGTP